MFYTIPSMATWIPGPRAVMHRNEKEIYLLRYVQVQKNFLKKHLGCRINCIFFSCNVLYCICRYVGARASPTWPAKPANCPRSELQSNILPNSG